MELPVQIVFTKQELSALLLPGCSIISIQSPSSTQTLIFLCQGIIPTVGRSGSMKITQRFLMVQMDFNPCLNYYYCCRNHSRLIITELNNSEICISLRNNFYHLGNLCCVCFAFNGWTLQGGR